MNSVVEKPLAKNGEKKPLAELDEKRLIGMARKGDRDASAELFDRNRAGVKARVMRRIYEKQDVNDVVQEVFLVYLQKIRTLVLGSTLQRWLNGIAKNLVLEHNRKTQKKDKSMPEGDEWTPAALEGDVLSEYVPSDFEAALQQVLPSGKKPQRYVRAYIEHYRKHIEANPLLCHSELDRKSVDDAKRQCLTQDGCSNPGQVQLRKMEHSIRVALSTTKLHHESRMVEQACDDRRNFLSALLSGAIATAFPGDLCVSPRNFAAVQSILRKYAECCRSPYDRTVLQKDFLKLGFEKRQDEGFPLEQTAAWLQALADSTLLDDAVQLAISSTETLFDADPTVWRTFRLVCRRIQARLHRQKRQMRQAREGLSDLEREWPRTQSPSRERMRRELATVAYELAYVEFQLGRIGQAKEQFQKSFRQASQASDRIGELIAQFMAMWCDYHARTIPSGSAKSLTLKYRDMLEEVAGEDERARQWRSNMNDSLFRVALDEKDGNEAKQLCDVVLGNEVHKRSEGDATYQIAHHNNLGRVAVVMGEPRTALRHFSVFLPVTLSEFGEREPRLVQICRDQSEIAVAFRDAGIALSKLRMQDLAVEVWKEGLACPDDTGNSFFKEDIRNLLK